MTITSPRKRHLSRDVLAAAGVGLAALSLTACGLTHPEDFPLDGPTRTATSNPAEVTAEQFGHSWTLKVDHGTVACVMNDEGDPVLTFTAPDGTVYALNALKENNDLPDISEIADGSIGTLRSFAFTVCDL